jgi:hypothetical protein
MERGAIDSSLRWVVPVEGFATRMAQSSKTV